ncbi:MAG: hypothetical protein QOG34_528 [Frankiaceae bacterium]|jgi:hypothetical protein|nr:hypothetical protein [Frankiaceae bacterium]
MALALATTSLEAPAALLQPAQPARSTLPVAPPLDALFPYGGMVRGSIVAVDSLTVALALLAPTSAAGGWCAAAGLPDLGLAAVADAGIDLSRFAVVAAPVEQWAVAIATLLDGVGAVLTKPPARVKPGDARRLAARVRERRGVLLVYGGWPEQVDLRIQVAASEWTGLSDGYGRLQRRRADLTASGRGAAARERRVTAWLPH